MGGEEGPYREERTLCHGSPEIGILRSMVLYSGCVADDAEAEKRNIVQIANLRNGGRLHINGKTVGETLLDGIQLRTVVMNWSPVQTSPLWMRLSIPASFSGKACFNREEHPS